MKMTERRGADGMLYLEPTRVATLELQTPGETVFVSLAHLVGWYHAHDLDETIVCMAGDVRFRVKGNHTKSIGDALEAWYARERS